MTGKNNINLLSEFVTQHVGIILRMSQHFANSTLKEYEIITLMYNRKTCKLDLL